MKKKRSCLNESVVGILVRVRQTLWAGRPIWRLLQVLALQVIMTWTVRVGTDWAIMGEFIPFADNVGSQEEEESRQMRGLNLVDQPGGRGRNLQRWREGTSSLRPRMALHAVQHKFL